MKMLLTRLTLVVVAAVVAVLAVHLILIAASLLRANRNLAKLVEGLEAIRDNTTPLDQDLSTINGAAGTLKNRLVTVDEHLRGIIQLVRG
jgi:HAMP domain-containing protein